MFVSGVGWDELLVFVVCFFVLAVIFDGHVGMILSPLVVVDASLHVSGRRVGWTRGTRARSVVHTTIQ